MCICIYTSIYIHIYIYIYSIHTYAQEAADEPFCLTGVNVTPWPVCPRGSLSCFPRPTLLREARAIARWTRSLSVLIAFCARSRHRCSQVGRSALLRILLASEVKRKYMCNYCIHALHDLIISRTINCIHISGPLEYVYSS